MFKNIRIGGLHWCGDALRPQIDLVLPGRLPIIDLAASRPRDQAFFIIDKIVERMVSILYQKGPLCLWCVLRVTAREVMHLANTNTEQRLGHYLTFGALFNPVVLLIFGLAGPI